MKKSKLIASLCSIGTLTSTTPIIATSCSNTNNELEIRLNKQ